jgi:hypothetical protein
MDVVKTLSDDKAYRSLTELVSTFSAAGNIQQAQKMGFQIDINHRSWNIHVKKSVEIIGR